MESKRRVTGFPLSVKVEEYENLRNGEWFADGKWIGIEISCNRNTNGIER